MIAAAVRVRIDLATTVGATEDRVESEMIEAAIAIKAAIAMTIGIKVTKEITGMIVEAVAIIEVKEVVGVTAIEAGTTRVVNATIAGSEMIGIHNPVRNAVNGRLKNNNRNLIARNVKNVLNQLIR
jgi:hypothetical protein